MQWQIWLSALQAVLQPSASLPQGTATIRGYDFNQGVSLTGIMDSMLTTGCQASALGQACNEVNRMVCSHVPMYILAIQAALNTGLFGSSPGGSAKSQTPGLLMTFQSQKTSDARYFLATLPIWSQRVSGSIYATWCNTVWWMSCAPLLEALRKTSSRSASRPKLCTSSSAIKLPLAFHRRSQHIIGSQATERQSCPLYQHCMLQHPM